MKYLNDTGVSYLITKIKTWLADKANKNHTHVASEITDLITPTKTSDLTNDSNFISSTVVTAFWTGTQAQYDALGTYSDTTLYLIKEG